MIPEALGTIGLEGFLLGIGLTALGLVLIRHVIVVLEAKELPEKPSARPVAPEEEEPAPPPGERLRQALSKSRELLRGRLTEALRGSHDRQRALEALEEVLVSADVGLRATGRILERLRERAPAGSDSDVLRRLLRQVVAETLDDGPLETFPVRPWVVVIAGVNGVGKTTSIAKLAARFQGENRTPLLVAADTFRAGAIEQLGVWADRLGVEIVRHQAGSDPAAVAFDGVKAARARDVDVVLLDTAGRLHTRQNLMEELRKVCRVVGREIPDAPHEIFLVLDATTGQNAVSQARTFTEAIGVTGIILTKLDGTAKGGAALAVREELGIPIRFIGVGERLDDLRPFSATDYAEALVGGDDEASGGVGDANTVASPSPS